MADGVTLGVLAELVGGTVCGSAETEVFGVSDLRFATSCDMSFLASHGDMDVLKKTKACCLVTGLGVDVDIPSLQVENPVLAITLIHRYFLARRPLEKPCLARDVIIGEGCVMASTVTSHSRVTIGARVRLGERVVLESGVVIGDDVLIGDDSHLMANVVVRAKSIVGKRVIIQSGTVVGSDGYGYVYDGAGTHIKRPHVGNVIIEDEVEIGANCCIDRATFGSTVVGRGSKVDNLVQIAHNVTIGQATLIVAQSGIAGSSSVGDGVVMGGQVAVADHVVIGDGAMIASKSGVRGWIKPGAVVSGYPAIEHKRWLKSSSAFPKLPQLVKQIRKLEKVVAELEKKNS